MTRTGLRNDRVRADWVRLIALFAILLDFLSNSFGAVKANACPVATSGTFLRGYGVLR